MFYICPFLDSKTFAWFFQVVIFNAAYATAHLFLHSVIFIDWMYCDRRGPENWGLSVCVSVCLCVCGEPFGETTGLISSKLKQMGPL